MRVRILGSAAGGGFPQWNCGCPGCRAVRDGTRPATPRTQSSIAVSPDGERWWLVNASPDVRTQLADTPALHPTGDRASPLQGVLLTDAEIDHTLGLVLLREGSGVHVHATAASERTLRAGTGLLDTLEKFCPVHWTPVVPGTGHDLGGLVYRAFDVPTAKHDRFGTGGDSAGRVVGYRFTDTASGRSAVYLPGVQQLTPAVLGELAGADVLLIDGTTWHDDEMIRLGLASKTAHDMGHLHVGGPGGSLDVLSRLGLPRVVYVHVNNTNPILLDDSDERAEVEKAGFTVGTDGLDLEV
ncbi:Coenzyme PQQ synthesis protein B [Pseudonocardia sp. Ae168_Ps1]|uniref:pyrroloquinoline quinone biosynthesis protein PqqB n=1 Tax=unclassified Pseudonocardia TaxID=2619320 RepID=UPI00094AA7B7|nr:MULTISPECIES: pyrroloquinoline quinone biosynthesis protein PqqB [unclassified Pseudonocardia]OLL70881.1 Coenzyme PQQ synthesis protein B [Pseudonocardia sp. Ae168_Ps1]OLL77565.1 Coenzyme PQQ synthesis protein B [Pseudonocardia sp. Ae150A_Ps1]OLL88321.1 Coenzyme PQQ synthesis protein B [Pseudonocardia sp. Ae263_Ps1]OLL91655.1 Coenzyme PQQ synthesis protein B [Pseudonocardia sp. Ae356_Ps1]